MKEHLQKAANDIVSGLDPDVVINALLMEKSVWAVSNFAKLPFLGRTRVPGGAVGLGALWGGSLAGYVSYMNSRGLGLKGKDRLKYIAKTAGKGAALGGLGGYAAQLGDRVLRARAGDIRHAKRKKVAFGTTFTVPDGRRGSRAVKVRTTEYARGMRKRAQSFLKKQHVRGKLDFGALVAGDAAKMLGA